MAETKRKRNYVNNPQFLEELKLYQTELKRCKENGLERPKISKYLGECVIAICTNLSKKPKFSSYSYRDEMVLDAIEACFKYALEAFDTERFSNPFAYFTQTAHNAYINRIKKEKIEQATKLRSMELLCLGNDEMSSMFYKNDQIQEYLKNIEESLKKKKAVSKKPIAIEKFIEE